MKTSNKIIVSFLTFAWLSFMATLLISHQFADYNNIPGMRRVITKADPLDKFSVVIIEQAAVLRIVSGDSAKLHYDELFGADIKPPEFEAIRDYHVQDDTLFIKNIHQATNGGFKLEVVGLKHLIVNNTTEIDLKGFFQDSLRITSINSKVTISKKSEFSNLFLKSGQKFDLTFKSVKEFSMVLSEDHCNVFGDIEEISGTVGNYARLGIPRETDKVNVDTSINGKLYYVFK